MNLVAMIVYNLIMLTKICKLLWILNLEVVSNVFTGLNDKPVSILKKNHLLLVLVIF